MLVVISGPSGAGKSTFVQALLASEPRLAYSVSTTTRPPRRGERNGAQYHFVSEAEFDRLVSAGAFVEWAVVHGHRYGTRRDHLDAMLAAGQIPLLDIDVQGGMRVSELYGTEVVSVFIFPPSWEVLESRLRARGTDGEAVISRRLANARTEIAFADRYDYFVVNDDLEAAVGRVRAIVTAEQCRRIRFLGPPLAVDQG